MVICRDLTDNDETWGYYIMGTTIWPFNIAMDNYPFIDDRNDESSMSSSDCVSRQEVWQHLPGCAAHLRL